MHPVPSGELYGGVIRMADGATDILAFLHMGPDLLILLHW